MAAKALQMVRSEGIKGETMVEREREGGGEGEERAHGKGSRKIAVS